MQADGYRRDKFTMRTTESPTVPLRKTSITDLPPEHLQVRTRWHQLEKDIIPTWMRMECPEGFEQSISALVQPSIPEDPNLKSPTLFPYSLAAVCSFWRDVLCSHPEFWTLIVLFADSKSTPLVDASLSWSGHENTKSMFLLRVETNFAPHFTRIDTKNVR
jgi:hypothetical protein